MDNNGVYKMKFEKSSFDINEDYDRLSEYEKERIAELDAETYFDYEENGSYICFIITSPIEMKKYTSILSKNLIKFEFSDLTKDVLISKIDWSINSCKSSISGKSYTREMPSILGKS